MNWVVAGLVVAGAVGGASAEEVKTVVVQVSPTEAAWVTPGAVGRVPSYDAMRRMWASAKDEDAGKGQLIPTDIRVKAELIPTDVAVKVVLCGSGTGGGTR